MTNLTVVVGAQFGSEGKGAITGYLARDFSAHDIVIRVAGPNAGHTAYDDAGREWKLRAVPVAAVTNPHCQLHIAAGSEVDLSVLRSEVDELDEAGHMVSDRLTIHPSATILDHRHRAAESTSGLIGRIGSTGKGIGAARADRIMRSAVIAADLVTDTREWAKLIDPNDGPFPFEKYDNIVIEGTQGYGLGLHTRFYPQVTSSDCRAIDFLAMAGISPWSEDLRLSVILVARVYPIRVAGNSGPLEGETTWAELGLPEERTTVTNNVRRVGAWDQALVLDAIRSNGGGDFHPNVKLALTMVDQRFPEIAGRTGEIDGQAAEFVANLEDELGCYIEYIGTGPRSVVES